MYEASNMGRIRSWLKRGAWQKDKVTPTIKKPMLNKLGYYVVGITVSKGRCKPFGVHRLVCLAFNGIPMDGLQASHINGNSKDNRPENLCWETILENNRRKAQHGTQYHGEEHGRSKLTELQIMEIRELRKRIVGNHRLKCNRQYSLRNIGRLFSIHAEQVRRICDGGVVGLA